MKIMEGVELDPKAFREQAGLVPRFPGLLTEVQKTPRRESRLSEAMVWDSERFCDAVQRQAKAKIGNKYLHCDHYNQFNNKHDHVIITFVNLEGRPVGAPAMNNRTQFTVDGFAAQLGQEPPTGKVKVKQLSGFVGKQAGLKFRAKTGTPEQIVKYLVDYIGQLAELEPKS